MSVNAQVAERQPFKDRSTWLMVFGVIQIVMGGLCGIMIPFMLLSLIAGSQGAGQTNVRMLIPAVGIYSGMAVLFVTLGVGSFRARRWARALTLVLAWMWLAMGIAALIMMAIWMPNMLENAGSDQQMQAEAMIIMQLIMFSTLGCMYLVVPVVFICFYRSAHVKATCEAKDPRTRWTDRRPLPVLALSLLLGFGAISVIFSLSYGGVMPFFGFLLKGVPGMLATLFLALLFAYLARSTYRLATRAWWLTLLTYIVLGVSTIVTFLRISLLEFYREVGFPEQQLALMEETGMFEQVNFPAMMGVSFLALVGYLLWVRKYFVPAQDGSVPSETAS